MLKFRAIFNIFSLESSVTKTFTLSPCVCFFDVVTLRLTITSAFWPPQVLWNVRCQNFHFTSVPGMGGLVTGGHLAALGPVSRVDKVLLYSADAVIIDNNGSTFSCGDNYVGDDDVVVVVFVVAVDANDDDDDNEEFIFFL
ncbi:hypothetical protein PoB_000901800 [Plakobranchus ocellatus]|uniref:Uncharacterized protein n=1 Tax=Plakobranchus ocellatus TaxID=259542 RepID=A0AAV3YJH4_9GAST|nr:hypothetical protein PoB_000901800 [Plakobranchus ocellatus]